MKEDTPKEKSQRIVNEIIDSCTHEVALQVASSLFQHTLEIKKKSQWSSAEDSMILTFFYLSSKEELCEALSCDMASLYSRARHLGVVSPTSTGITATDLANAVYMFSDGCSQDEVLKLYGIDSITVPVKSLTSVDYQRINDHIRFVDSAQMELFADED